ncbi:MAG: hypothetical protein ABI132_03970 [Rhodanobacteraceae bacterium]
MLFDTISPVVFATDLLLVESPLDVESTHRSLPKIAVHAPKPHFVRFIEGDGSRPSDNPISLIVKHRDLQHAEEFTSRKWLVQDRLGGAMVRHGDRVFGRVSQS